MGNLKTATAYAVSPDTSGTNIYTITATLDDSVDERQLVFDESLKCNDPEWLRDDISMSLASVGATIPDGRITVSVSPAISEVDDQYGQPRSDYSYGPWRWTLLLPITVAVAKLCGARERIYESHPELNGMPLAYKGWGSQWCGVEARIRNVACVIAAGDAGYALVGDCEDYYDGKHRAVHVENPRETVTMGYDALASRDPLSYSVLREMSRSRAVVIDMESLYERNERHYDLCDDAIKTHLRRITASLPYANADERRELAKAMSEAGTKDVVSMRMLVNGIRPFVECYSCDDNLIRGIANGDASDLYENAFLGCAGGVFYVPSSDNLYDYIEDALVEVIAKGKFESPNSHNQLPIPAVSVLEYDSSDKAREIAERLNAPLLGYRKLVRAGLFCDCW